MIFEWLAIPAVLILVGTSLTILMDLKLRWSLFALGVQFIATFWLLGLNLPVALAAVKLVVGLIAVALIMASLPAEEVDLETPESFRYVFRILAAGLVWLLVFSLAPYLESILDARIEIIWGGLILVGVGLLQLGMTSHPPRVILGLLTLLSGFHILYSSIEKSALVSGLLAVVTLGLGLVCVYWAASQVQEEQP
ncbi:MAG: hypothetical protein AB9891_16310 [Anaerolineaceae bacterium]